MKTEQFGVDLARQLYAAERALDVAIAETNDLAALMTRGRLRARISAGVGQEALAEVGGLVAKLTAQRARIVRAHELLLRDATDLNIPWQAAGPMQKPEEDGPVRPTGFLRVA